jgi:hypothetical protein
LNRFKKAISVGMTATLLASIMAVVAAPAAMASITGTSAGNVAQGSTSAGTASYLFTENSIAALPNAPGSMTVTITPAAPGTGTVSWSGTPVVSAPGSLGASASILGNVLTINVAASDVNNIETISISGLKVTASATASPGAVVATLSAGAIGTSFSGGTVTATGKLAQAYGIGTTVFAVANDLGSCPFSGTNNVTVGTEVLAGATVSGPGVPVAGQQTFTTNAMTNNHLANEVVSQVVPNCNILVLPSPATVVQALAYSSHGNPTVFPGENNSPAASVDLVEPAAGFLAVGNTITLTIDTAGVVFSNVPPAATLFAGDIGLGAPVLSADRKSVSVTVTTASTVASGIHFFGGAGILYDVAATVPAGTFVSLTATATGKIVLPTTVTNAVVFRGVTATAPTPTVYIGENNQATGMITVKESAAGFFQAGTGSNNVLSICPTGALYAFTFAPVARVVGGTAAGNVILREGAVASTDNIVTGAAAAGGCFEWTVWSASTVASTIEIGNDGFTSGPLINVTVNQNPGLVAVQIRSGNGSGFDNALIATVGFATAAYRNSVAVTALSQTAIPAGALNALVGDLQVSETGIGQLKAGEWICVEVLPRSFTSGGGIQDVFFGNQATANVPVATASGGLVVGPVQFVAPLQEEQLCGPTSGGAPSTQTTTFRFPILQQSTAGNGKVVISNIHYTTTADAADGLVQVLVSGAILQTPTVVAFQQTVSNARIGAQPSATAASRLGVTQTGAFSTSTKVAKVTKYVTFRFDFGVAAAGKTIQILGATKTGNDWSAFANVTSRVANASGVVYYYIRQGAPTWKSYRAYWAAAGILTAGRQARWIP